MSNYLIVGGELCHYGVKGMKWGVRKKRYSDDVYQKKATYKDTKKVESKRLTDKQKKTITAVGWLAASSVVGIIGAKIASDPKLRGLVRKGMDAVSTVSTDADPFAGFQVVDKLGNLVDLDI